VNILKGILFLALTLYFVWAAASATVTGRIPNFGNPILRRNRPAQFWFQIALLVLMAAGLAIYTASVIYDALESP